MWNNTQDAYLESRVLTADPIELVNLLYQGCMQAIREARVHLAEGRIAERSREINKACQIVIELATSLDHERGGEISQRLAVLYDYMQRRLLEANMQQSDTPLADVLGLLGTLSEAWAEIRCTAEKPAIESPKPLSVPRETETRALDQTWSQPVAQETEKPSVEMPLVDSPWLQPVPEEAGYAPQGYAANAYASQAWSL
jgi:flagellar protein FliS